MQTPPFLVLVGLSERTKLYPGNSNLFHPMEYLNLSKFQRHIISVLLIEM